MNPLQWFVPWETSFPIIIVAAVTAILFIRGSLKCKLLFRQKLLFWTGLLSLYIIAHTQADYYAQHEFFVHQLQSLVLHSLGPFFIVLSCPKGALLAGFPMVGKQLIPMVSERRPLQCLANVLLHPVVAVIFVRGTEYFLVAPFYPLYHNARLGAYID